MRKSIPVLVLCVMVMANVALAITVRGIDIDFVTIGNAGNAGDPAGSAGYGAVNYNYQIGKYEVTNGQWDSFVSTAGAPTGNDGGYIDASYWTDTNVPTNNVSWYEAAQFCNYLTSGDKSFGAYLFSGNNANPGDFLGVDRDSAVSAYGTVYVLPTVHEWYKAAYYTGSDYSLYANGTDVVPIAGVDTNYDDVIGQPWEVGVGNGTQEQNGTFDMMGNVVEWNETGVSGGGKYLRGGAYPHDYLGLMSLPQHRIPAYYEYDVIGFRVASVSGPAVLRIYVDIKPQSCPNPLNVKSKGVLPIAILGTADVNVYDIDVASILLAGVDPNRSGYEDVATALVDANECECTVEGPDGFLDLTLKFDRQAIIEAIGEVVDGEELILEFTGELYDGTPIIGEDCVIIRAKSNSKNK